MNTTHPNAWQAIWHTLDTRQRATFPHNDNRTIIKHTYISNGRLCMDCQHEDTPPVFMGSMTTSAAARLADNLQHFAKETTQ